MLLIQFNLVKQWHSSRSSEVLRDLQRYRTQKNSKTSEGQMQSRNPKTSELELQKLIALLTMCIKYECNFIILNL